MTWRGKQQLPPELVVLLDAERKKRSWRRYLPLWVGAVGVGLAVGAAPYVLPSRTEGTSVAALAAPSSHGGSTVSFGFCHTGGGTNCVVDGDTIWLAGENIRIADIDPPETHEARCPAEHSLGERATQRLHQLVNSGTVTLGRSGIGTTTATGVS